MDFKVERHDNGRPTAVISCLEEDCGKETWHGHQVVHLENVDLNICSRLVRMGSDAILEVMKDGASSCPFLGLASVQDEAEEKISAFLR